jgi:hypothetical protein
MNKAEYFCDLVKRLQARGYSFLLAHQPFELPKQMQMSGVAKFAVSAMAGIAGGIAAGPLGGMVGALGAGTRSNDKTRLVADLGRIKEHCDLVGINLSSVYTLLLVALDADALTDEAIFERCKFIHDRARDFVKYSLSQGIMGQMGVRVSLVLTFSSRRRTEEFMERRSAKKCKHWRKNVTITPVIKDLETGSVFDASGREVAAR